MNKYTQELYEAAKNIVSEIEANENIPDEKKRTYTYAEMQECFSKGIERGIYVAAAIYRKKFVGEIPLEFKVYIQKYKT